MKCRDFINEFEERGALSDTAARHLSDCLGCQKTSRLQSGLWRVIGEFKQVDAPQDFNFRVKARIANAKPKNNHSPLFPILRYVLPFSAIVLILTFVVFNEIYSLSDKTAPPIAESDNKLLKQKEDSASPTNSLTARQTVEDSRFLEVAQPAINNQVAQPFKTKKKSETYEDKNQYAAVKNVKKPQIKTALDNEKGFDGSHDNASSASRNLTPKGLNPTKTVEPLPNAGSANPVTVEQILSELGIEIALENGRRQVKKIKSNSVAERSAVKVGDLIEAIDGVKLTSEPVRSKTIEGKKLVILRGAEKIEILLHN